MSAKVFSRDYAQGKVKKLQRMKQPLAIKQVIYASPRNPVVQALVHRAITAGAGKHIRSPGASRRAERMALQKLVREWDEP